MKAAPAGKTVEEGGTLATGEKAAAQVLERTYLNSYVAHAPMETHSAVAAVENGKVTVWASTQTPFPLKNQVMQALDLPAEKVRVITPFVGGGFGGKSAGRQAIEAARLAVAAGVPVRVVWSRAGGVLLRHVPARGGAEDQVRRRRRREDHVLGLRRSSRPASAGPSTSTTSRTIARWLAAGGTRIRLGCILSASAPWRAPAANSNAFARESQIDVMAAAAAHRPGRVPDAGTSPIRG